MIATQTRVHTRWMIQRDCPEVCAISSKIYDDPLTMESLAALLRQQNVIGQVAYSDNDNVLGFFIYEMRQTCWKLLHFAVDLDHNGQGIGRTMMEKMISKLSDRRPKLVTLVHEENVYGQMFLKKMGLRCVKTLPRYYGDRDGYKFQITKELA